MNDVETICFCLKEVKENVYKKLKMLRLTFRNFALTGKLKRRRKSDIRRKEEIKITKLGINNRNLGEISGTP